MNITLYFHDTRTFPQQDRDVSAKGPHKMYSFQLTSFSLLVLVLVFAHGDESAHKGMAYCVYLNFFVLLTFRLYL